jgi:hypothetical protein
MFAEGVEQAHVEELLQLLRSYGWVTRRTLKQLKGWSPRTTRAIAEAAGDEVIRGPRGFNAFEKCSLDEIEHCAAIAEAQGNKMLAYAVALRKRAHQKLG